MILTVPELSPVTVPNGFTVALNVLLLVHVPPDGVPVKASVEPIHAILPPVMDGDVLMVTDL